MIAFMLVQSEAYLGENSLLLLFDVVGRTLKASHTEETRAVTKEDVGWNVCNGRCMPVVDEHGPVLVEQGWPFMWTGILQLSSVPGLGSQKQSRTEE